MYKQKRVQWIYTVSQKRETLYSCPYLCKILTDFYNFFTDILSWKVAIILLMKIPPHLKCVATLPCEMLMFANRATFCQSLMVSVSVSKVGCTHLIFVDPGVKINGCYYCEVLLSQQLLPAIRQVSGDFWCTVLHRRTGYARQSSCCNERRLHSSHLICGLRIAQISTQ